MASSAESTWSGRSLAFIAATTAGFGVLLHGCDGGRYFAGQKEESPEERMRSIQYLNAAKPQLVPLMFLTQRQVEPPRPSAEEKQDSHHREREEKKRQGEFSLTIEVKSEAEVVTSYCSLSRPFSVNLEP